MHLRGASVPKGAQSGPAVLEATPGQMDGLFSQLPFKCYLPEVECMEDGLSLDCAVEAGWSLVSDTRAGSLAQGCTHTHSHSHSHSHTHTLTLTLTLTHTHSHAHTHSHPHPHHTIAVSGCRGTEHRRGQPPWRQPRGKWMISFGNSHTNVTLKRWHLWEID